VVLVLLTAVRLVGRVEELRSFKHGTAQFLDFRIFFEAVARAEETGQLYASDRPDFFLPGSAVYKFPPPFAATLTPFTEYDWLPVAKLFVVVNLFLLACVLTVFWRSVRPQGWRWVLVSLVFLNWQPFWETLLGVQLEIGILLLLTLGLASVRTGRFLTSGAVVGVAAAFKVYPVFLLSYFVLWRRWRGLVGAVIGGGGALLVATVVISLGESIRYFVEILPRLGGTSLSPENLSLVAQAVSATCSAMRIRIRFSSRRPRGSGFSAFSSPDSQPCSSDLPPPPFIVRGRPVASNGKPCRGAWPFVYL